MGFGVPQQRILLLQYVLLAFLLSHVSVARRVSVEINQLLVDETSDLKRDGTDDHRDNHVHQLGMTSGLEHRDNPSSFHIDDSTKTSLFFFSPKDLKAGNRIPLYFSKKLAWTSKLLPRDEADSIFKRTS
ncbi:hypothetical protein TIFTF001_045097 [Ficus carica]|uniref:BURP domain-containing protein n=1 Tax=Ficus carica TaxID=3494 RepID=A0AA87YZ05_FICCA|nr:hypothetical protein TIFTF001_045097 [Ficus carica]